MDSTGQFIAPHQPPPSPHVVEEPATHTRRRPTAMWSMKRPEGNFFFFFLFLQFKKIK
jgi:hypothetical protein